MKNLSAKARLSGAAGLSILLAAGITLGEPSAEAGSETRNAVTRQAGINATSDTLAVEIAKQKGSGKLIVYVTSSDPRAVLSITAQPVAATDPPIDLGTMSKTSQNGPEFFITKKGLAPISFVEITSSSGGVLAARSHGRHDQTERHGQRQQHDFLQSRL